MRLIDDIIRAVEEHPLIPRVHKAVLIARIEEPPTREELDLATDKVWPVSSEPHKPTIKRVRYCGMWVWRYEHPNCVSDLPSRANRVTHKAALEFAVGHDEWHRRNQL